MTWDPNEYNLTLNAMQQDHEFNEVVPGSGGASYGAKGLKPPPDFAQAPQIFV